MASNDSCPDIHNPETEITNPDLEMTLLGGFSYFLQVWSAVFLYSMEIPI